MSAAQLDVLLDALLEAKGREVAIGTRGFGGQEAMVEWIAARDEVARCRSAVVRLFDQAGAAEPELDLQIDFCERCGARLLLKYPATRHCINQPAAPEGHDHNDNAGAAIYECAFGHEVARMYIPTCDKCDWVGSSTNHGLPHVPRYSRLPIHIGEVRR